MILGLGWGTDASFLLRRAGYRPIDCGARISLDEYIILLLSTAGRILFKLIRALIGLHSGICKLDGCFADARSLGCQNCPGPVGLIRGMAGLYSAVIDVFGLTCLIRKDDRLE